MPETIKVLYLAAEAEPYVKIGGLGDVAGSLPKALRNLSAQTTGGYTIDVRLVLPLHPVIRETGLKPLGMFGLRRGSSEITVEVFESSLHGMPVYFIKGEPIHASGSIYSADPTIDAEKYTFFSLAAIELPRLINWAPDLLHVNDWHTALALYGALTKRWEEGARPVASVITIHNLTYMGPDASDILASYGVRLAQTDLPDWARYLPLPLGLWASDAIVAVSPSYADEIANPEHGLGLENFFKNRRGSVHGILNGLDVESFDPSDDPALGVPYNAETIDQRKINKGVLQERLGYRREPETPLIAMVSRLDPQKGVDLALNALREIKKSTWQAVILGTGDPQLEAMAAKLQEELPDKVHVEIRYDSGLARQIYSGADLFLMPSRNEPCGLSQMIAMRYGCVPVVRATGGLKDTVKHFETGFVFEEASAYALAEVLQIALRLYHGKTVWRKIQLAGMEQDFSWSKSALQYAQLYRSLTSSKRI